MTGKEPKKCVCGQKRPDATDEDHGYTTRTHLAMRSEPEAIPASVQEDFSKDAREKREKQLEERRRRSADAIGDLAVLAKSQEVKATEATTKRRLRAARRQLEDANRRINAPEAALSSGLALDQARKGGAGAEGSGTAAR